jgi:polar amino acid transport system permease protein
LIILVLLCPLLAAPATAQSPPITVVTVSEKLFPVDRASIYIDDVYVGNTDNAGKIILYDYTQGTHRITAIRDGYVNTTLSANFTGDARINVQMEYASSAARKNDVSIIVLENSPAMSKIAGVDVFVDGQNVSVGKTNTLEGMVKVNLTAGRHVITVSKSGDKRLLDNTTTIDAVPGGSYTVLMSSSGKKFSILDPDLFINSMQKIIFNGLVNTLLLSIVAFALGIFIGLFMGIGRTSHNFIIRMTSSIYVEGVRGLPLLLQLLFVFFGLPFLISDYTGGTFNIDIFTAAVIALSINSGAYMAEIFKAGIEAVHKGQTEAARSLGMTQNQALRYIILPQAFKIVLPALGNEFIALCKDSSIAMVISYTEIIYWAKAIGVEHYNTFTPLLAAGIVYLMITLPLGKAVQYMEKKYNVNARKDNLPGKKKKIIMPAEAKQ